MIASAVSRHVHAGDSLETVAAAHDCSRRQAGRWVSWTAAVAEPAVLLTKVGEAVGAPVLPAIPPLAARLRAHRERARERVRQLAAQVLALTEALASALGLEPPGLQSVVERFLAGRTHVGTYRRPAIPDLARCAQPM